LLIVSRHFALVSGVGRNRDGTNVSLYVKVERPAPMVAG
jgi:hypothetical protein